MGGWEPLRRAAGRSSAPAARVGRGSRGWPCAVV